MTKTTLYHVVGWGLRLYVCSLVVVGGYSLLWVLKLAGVVPETWPSAIWIGSAVMGCLFLVLLVPLFYSARSSAR
ncbi:hypothetical protein [Natronorubrum tibetense]|uniref:Uncharacterized protein n=1 Tax=Natronorubrum tibetense GA33 TaxID=1114856 RepID=L9W7Z7_9EURY|nr:hypothetical protein [Natronorubrum tibetense]ELY45381.1 hypothetical protein C496_03133 [Natronorubrum tibetense GA33]